MRWEPSQHSGDRAAELVLVQIASREKKKEKRFEKEANKNSEKRKEKGSLTSCTLS